MSKIIELIKSFVGLVGSFLASSFIVFITIACVGQTLNKPDALVLEYFFSTIFLIVAVYVLYVEFAHVLPMQMRHVIDDTKSLFSKSVR